MERIWSPALQAGDGGGVLGLDEADGGGAFAVGDGLADGPDDAGEEEGEGEAEERPGEGDDDFLPGRGGREFLARGLAFALDGFHGRHLRQGDVAAGGDGAEDVFDAVDFAGPERMAEPDGEFVDLEPAPFGGEEVAELMDDDEDVEEGDDFQEGDDGKGERDEAVDDAEGDEEAEGEEEEAPEAEVGPDGPGRAAAGLSPAGGEFLAGSGAGLLLMLTKISDYNAKH